MKKILLLLFVMMTFVSVAFAKGSLIGQVQNPDLLTLGGIKLNDTNSQVINLYGEPAGKFRSDKPIKDPFFIEPYFLWEYHYGETVKLQFIQPISEKKLYATKVESTANNGWKTPSGLTVGMKTEEIKKRMGDNCLQETKDKSTVYSYHDGAFYLAFYDKNGIISKIELYSAEARHDNIVISK
jgi:hypothetical protein